ncbi:MAG: hypothetical protein GXY52_06020 [Chloroflexi bacterium]|nr:hypothetical protein [Chloroflexota bacterium]
MARRSASRPGAAIAEWVVVTIILTIATFALLQAVGPELVGFIQQALEKIKSIF